MLPQIPATQQEPVEFETSLVIADGRTAETVPQKRVGKSKSCVLRSGRAYAITTIQMLFVIAYLVYLGFALHFNARGSVFLCIITPVVLATQLNTLSKGRLSKLASRLSRTVRQKITPSRRAKVWLRRITTVACVVGVFVFLIVDNRAEAEKWIPLGGIAVFISVGVVFSKQRNKIDWVPVTWGILLQFGLGLVILRWRTGYHACQWAADQITAFLAYTDRGSEFVFGANYNDHPIAFKVLPMLIFFSAISSVLYHLGAMQLIIKAIALVLQTTMNVTPIEAFAASAHIFFGLTEVVVILRPYLNDLTNSELHGMMTVGFATVAGGMFAAYVEFGIAAEHILSASFMSAPAAIAMAKLSMPETELSELKAQKDIKPVAKLETNVIEALSVGATAAIKQIAYIAVNLIAFLAAIAFIDAVVAYLGQRVGLDFNFQLICSYVCMPIAIIMGVPLQDARHVGNLIGKKWLTSELLAYADLSDLRLNGKITERSAVIATYILCGFGSVVSMGIAFGTYTSTAPARRKDVSKLCLRAIINGNIACFMTACVAGLLFQDGHSFVDSGNLTYGTSNITLNYGRNASYSLFKS